LVTVLLALFDLLNLERTNMTSRFWNKLLLVAGYLAMLLGAVEPMEGSIAILLGSAAVALGAWLGPESAPARAYRFLILVLLGIGVGALWGLSSAGGIGGPSGRSTAWALLIAPYPVAWLMALLGRGTPRWVAGLGLGVGLWYLTLATLIMARAGASPDSKGFLPAIGLALIGAIAVSGCAFRLWPGRLRLKISKMAGGL